MSGKGQTFTLFFCSPCLEAMYVVMACKVFPACSIKVSSRFRFVGAFMCGSEMSKLSAAEAVVDVELLMLLLVVV